MVGGIENKGESMPRTRKSHPPSLKAKVAIEAIKGHKTAAQIAQMFGVHPTQVGGWKKQALAGLPDVFHLKGSDRWSSGGPAEARPIGTGLECCGKNPSLCHSEVWQNLEFLRQQSETGDRWMGLKTIRLIFR